MTRKSSNAWLSLVLLSLALGATASCTSPGGGYSSGSGGYPTSPPPPTTPKELDSGDIGGGGTFQHRFAAAGTFGYHCIHHSPMTGSVQVSSGAADTLVNVSITSSTMSFPGASVRPGGRVIWTNNTGVAHTVTSN
jgi:plastocyanin